MERMLGFSGRSLRAIFALTFVVTGCSSSGGDDDPHGGHGGVHMAELSDDLTKLYLTNSEKNQLTVVDAKKLGADSSDEALLNRAYVVSRDSEEVAVIDLRTLELVKKPTYDVIRRIPVGAGPTHLSLSRDGKLLAVMDEDEGTGAVSFIDVQTDKEIKRLSGFYTPHFMRFDHDNQFGYVANIGAHHLTRVNLSTLEIDSHIALDGAGAPPNATLAPDEGGFGDAQIDANGMLFAAHHATGRVLVYDTGRNEKKAELNVGGKPWMAYAEHPFVNVPSRPFVTNFGNQTVSIIDAITTGAVPSVIATLEGDEEAYGVNFSSLAPNKAFVMNRVREDIAVVDTNTRQITKRIAVGGNTETAATTADGKWIIAAVSSKNRVVVIDAKTEEIVKTFENVGNYPWSVTVPKGQNYCH